jgi:osmoprotectant transport system substrate-binding protein
MTPTAFERASMRSIKRTVAITGAALSLSLAGCGLGGETETTTDVGAGDNTQEGALEGVSVDVGSKDFDEQLILGQLTLLTLQAAGAEVTDKTNIQGSTQARTDLIKEEIDVYWDYTGTGWINFLGHDEIIPDAEEQYQKVKEEDLKENDLVWGERAPFNNTYSMAPTQDFAEENDITTLSDMAAYIEANDDYTVCVESEFATRPDGLPALEKAYGISIPESNIQTLGTGVIYTQIEKGECTFGEIFTTDGRIAALGLLALEDDKTAFPIYNGVPITNAKNSDSEAIQEVLAPLAETLTTEVMTELNKQKSGDGLPEEQIAEDYLKEQGFIG